MNEKKPSPEITPAINTARQTDKTGKDRPPRAKEIGGFADHGLPEPTRYGDWDVNGRCSDF